MSNDNDPTQSPAPDNVVPLRAKPRLVPKPEPDQTGPANLDEFFEKMREVAPTDYLCIFYGKDGNLGFMTSPLQASNMVFMLRALEHDMFTRLVSAE